MRFRRVLAATSIAILLTGCGATTEGATDEDPPSGSNAGKADKSKKAEPAAQDDGTTKLGGAYTWDNGLTVKVSKPRPFKPDEYAAGWPKWSHVRISVTVVNKTGKPYDAAIDYISLQSGNAEP